MYFPLPFRGVDVKSSMFEIGDTDLKPVYSVNSPLYSRQLPSYRIANVSITWLKQDTSELQSCSLFSQFSATCFFPKPDLLNVPNFIQPDSRCKRIYAKKSVHFTKLKSQQIVVISKLFTKIYNFNEIPYKYLVNTILKLKKYFCPSFLWIFTHTKTT